MTERERLIELLRNADDNCLSIPYIGYNGAVAIAEFLLANGVIVPPCKIGDDIWYIDHTGTVRCEKGDIRKIIYCGDGDFEIMDKDGAIDEVGTNYAYLTKEEAEQALQKGN